MKAIEQINCEGRGHIGLLQLLAFNSLNSCAPSEGIT